jgi:hypothetical protein
MRLLLLGAGASKAYEDSPTGVRMPIARDFFSTFEKLKIYENPWVLRDGIIDYIARIKGEDPDRFLRSNVDIEQLYSEIEQYVLDSYNGHPIERVLAFKSYTQLTFIFAAVLNEIQNGPPSPAHLALARKLDSEDTVVTFNWDTLMDRAMQVAGGWNVDAGYGFRPKSIYRGTWLPPKSTDESRSANLIKLHGSTNWLSSHPINVQAKYELTQQARPDTVWVYENTSAPYACYAGRYMAGYEDFSYGYYPPNIVDDPGRKAPDGRVIVRARLKFPWVPEGTAPDDGLVSIPLIIPPVRYKKYAVFGSLFDELWKTAEDGIQAAHHIIIIGYSFPKTDLRSSELFLSALRRRNTIPFVTILDPAPEEIVHRFRIQFGLPASHLTVRRELFTKSTNVDQLFKI